MRNSAVLTIILSILLIQIAFAAIPTEQLAYLTKPAVVYVRNNITGTFMTEGKQMPFQLESHGSGSFINTKGYLVTNAHVVTANPDEVKYGISSINMISPAKISDIKFDSKISVLFQTAQGIKEYPAEIMLKGEPYPGKDVAILKIEKEVPTIVFQGETEIGSTVIVVGFPAAAEIGQDKFEPTVTRGIVSAVKHAPTGWKLIQIDAAIAPGSSGGPVFNENGQAVGIATLGSEATQGFNWYVPLEVIQQLLDTSNIKQQQGVIDEVYKRALEKYYDGDLEESIDDFKKVIELYPEHSTAPIFLTKARYTLEKESKNTTKNTILIIAGIIVGGGLIAFLAFILLSEHAKLTALKEELKVEQDLMQRLRT